MSSDVLRERKEGEIKGEVVGEIRGAEVREIRGDEIGEARENRGRSRGSEGK